MLLLLIVRALFLSQKEPVLRERFPAAHVTHRATKRAPCVAIYFQVAAEEAFCLNVLSAVSLSRSVRVCVRESLPLFALPAM